MGQAKRAATKEATNSKRLRVVQTKPQKPPSLAKELGFIRQLGRIDVPFLTLILVILVFGLVMLFSASYPTGYMRFGDSYAFIQPQIRYALLGIVVMAGAALVDYHILRKFAWPLMFVTLVLLVVVLFMDEKNGAKRWIWLNSAQSQSVQPSEIAKFAIILLFAALLSANQKRIKTFAYGFLPFVALLGIVAALMLQQPHLSGTILILGIGVTMMFAGGVALRWFIMSGVIGVASFSFLVASIPTLVPYAMNRIEIWLDPYSVDPDLSHQTIQSLIAVGSGGLTGNGIGGSVQKFLYLPEMYNDYIFAIVCEELGFFGALCLIVLFLLLLLRGLHIALRAKDRFGSMLCVGVAAQIALQTFLHIAVNTNTTPPTGISLPFFSSGGSSLVMLMGQVGIMLSVSRQAYSTLAQAKEAQESELLEAPVQQNVAEEA